MRCLRFDILREPLLIARLKSDWQYRQFIDRLIPEKG